MLIMSWQVYYVTGYSCYSLKVEYMLIMSWRVYANDISSVKY